MPKMTKAETIEFVKDYRKSNSLIVMYGTDYCLSWQRNHGLSCLGCACINECNDLLLAIGERNRS